MAFVEAEPEPLDVPQFERARDLGNGAQRGYQLACDRKPVSVRVPRDSHGLAALWRTQMHELDEVSLRVLRQERSERQEHDAQRGPLHGGSVAPRQRPRPAQRFKNERDAEVPLSSLFARGG